MKAALIVLLVIILILLIPVSLRVKYDGYLEVFAGHIFSFKVYPSKKKKKKALKKKKDKPKSAPPKKAPLSVEEIISLVKISLGALKKIIKSIRITFFKLNIIVSGSDAAKAAVNYGNVCMAVSSLYPIIEGKKRIKRADVSVDIDYGGKSSLFLDITVKAILLKLLIIAVSTALLLIKYLPIIKKEGGKNK